MSLVNNLNPQPKDMLSLTHDGRLIAQFLVVDKQQYNGHTVVHLHILYKSTWGSPTTQDVGTNWEIFQEIMDDMIYQWKLEHRPMTKEALSWLV
jgi:hypothetical protein